ncbi:MAG: LysM peptidoglycan-binding domain-containing protein [Polaribacter sp.]|uniref:LysM peptidoglycan-binding domain-containing protein n=1 Tax=Polaribacter sp. TaxID=1920175 RepID=UPI00326476AD
MIKTYLTIITILCYFTSFTQNNEATSKFDKIILDGKTAYMNIITGEVVKDIHLIENDTTKNISSFQNNSLIHIVERGETLYAISRIYGISVSKLKKLNGGIQFNTLKINQKILIGTKDKNINLEDSNEHVVEKEDTLYSLSKLYNVSITDLKKMNNLDANLIFIGQRLRIK